MLLISSRACRRISSLQWASQLLPYGGSGVLRRLPPTNCWSHRGTVSDLSAQRARDGGRGRPSGRARDAVEKGKGGGGV